MSHEWRTTGARPTPVVRPIVNSPPGEVKVNHYGDFVGQGSSRSKVVVPTRRETHTQRTSCYVWTTRAIRVMCVLQRVNVKVVCVADKTTKLT